MVRIAAILLVIGACLLAAEPAAAQFGGIFGNQPPPRPPGDVPNSGFPAQPPPVQNPGQSARPPAPAGPPPSGIQAQPLPPPPGASAAPAPASAGTPPVPPSPAQRARGAPQPGSPSSPQPATPPQPADTPVQSDDTVVTETPTQHIPNSRAVFSGLDKITGRIISFDAAINETVQFGALQVTARACYTRPPTEATNTDAFVDVDEVTLKGEIKRIFTGWMYASSPGLHAVEHPIYDVWLTDCSAPVPSPVAQSTAPPVAPAPTAAAPAPQRPRQPPPSPRPPAAPTQVR
jgi:hypothetical protein